MTSPDPAARKLSRLKVLVVDDNRQIRLLVGSVLQGAVADIRECENAVSALEVWKAWKPDVVLVDFEMPGVNGAVFTRVIRDLENGRARRTPILMMTAHSDHEHVSKAAAAGVDGFLAKPLSVGSILAKVQAVTERSAAVQANGSGVPGGLDL